jgi:hypothetical protein
MVIRRKVTVSNPHRSKLKRKAKRNPKKLSAKQIKFFGTKRQRAALKAKRKKTNPVKVKTRTRTIIKKVYVKAKRRKSNPRKRATRKVVARRRRKNPSIISLGLLNPHKGVSMTKKRKTRRHRVVAKRHNPTRRRTVHVAKRHHRRGRRNPSGIFSSGQRAVAVLLGVGAQKLAKGFVPASITGGSAPMGLAISAALAIGIGMAAKKFAPGMGDDIGLGAMAVVASDAIGVLVPSLSPTFGLSGLGFYSPAQFAVPENPIMRGVPAPAVSPAKGVGLLQGRAF